VPPPGYHSGSPQVICTAWEMFRDAWPHGYGAHIDGCLVWDTLPLQKHFDPIMYHLRGWDVNLRASTCAKRTVMRSYARAIKRLRALVLEYDVPER
jgi:hypothetical protein